MSSFVSQQDFNEMLIWETAIIMLRKPERDMAYGDEASWHFIETVLTGENDRKACIHFLKSEAAHLAKLGTECIKIGSERSRELCLLLRNTYFAECRCTTGHWLGGVHNLDSRLD